MSNLFQRPPKLSVGTFNVRGLNPTLKKQQLADDLERYDVQICNLQETKIQIGFDDIIGSYRVFCLPSESRHYGLGFAVHKSLRERIHRVWSESDRVAVIQIRLSEKCFFSIVNVYAPTSTRVADDPACLDQFYSNLNTALTKVRSSSIFLVAGDFNAKLGQRNDSYQCIGAHGRGRRNFSGTVLADFCDDMHLFACNTAFQHPARHRTTWTGWRRGSSDVSVPIYNQIDYVLCQSRQRQLFTDARSYAGTVLESDHRIVVARMEMSRLHGVWRAVETSKRSAQTQKILVTNLADSTTRTQYQSEIESVINNQQPVSPNTSTSPDATWNSIQQSVMDTARNVLGVDRGQKRKRKWIMDDESLKMCEEKRKIRLQLLNNKTTDSEVVARLKHQRNVLSHQIRQKAKENAARFLDTKAQEIEAHKDDVKMFQAVHLLQRKHQQPIVVHDDDGRTVLRTSETASIITSHFSNAFTDTDSSLDRTYHTILDRPVTESEVSAAARRLKNGRAAGPDGMPAELIKYGPPSLHRSLAALYTTAISEDKPMSIGHGALIPLQKPGKVRGPPANLRPIVLLTVLRKVLSLVTLIRIRPAVNQYLSPNQSGFRSKRSTSDVVWSYRWLAARCQKFKESFHVLGIDMSKAFDTISRQRLLDVLTTFLAADEVSMISYLLRHTTLEVRLPGFKGEVFNTNRGTPQGDSLSPVLFVVYLEAALQDVRLILSPRPQLDLDLALPSDTEYADDVDFLSSGRRGMAPSEEARLTHR